MSFIAIRILGTASQLKPSGADVSGNPRFIETWPEPADRVEMSSKVIPRARQV